MLFKRMFCLLLVCLMSLGAVAVAEEEQGQTFVMAGFDDLNYRDWKSNAFFARMEEVTGVAFDLIQYTKPEEWAKAKADMKAGADMPDVLFKAGLTDSECVALKERGALMDLTPYLQENCPNLWAILQENPAYLSAITLPDGSIVALPYITDLPTQNYLWINSAWLNGLRLPMPTTADELVSVLTAFRDRDPNKNGRKDEIPLGFLGPFDLKFLAHAFGLIGNDYNLFVREGQVQFMPLDENYRLFVTWCRDLYREGLLDRSGFSINSAMRQVTDSDATATYGAIFAPLAAEVFRVKWASDYVLVPPLVYEGKQIYRNFVGNVFTGTFAVTTACEDPARMLRWVDYLYTEPGAILMSIGKEDVDYVIDPDGTWRLSEAASGDAMFSNTSLIEGGGINPGIFADDFQSRFGASKDVSDIIASQQRFAQLTQRPFPYYFLTDEQQAQILPLQEQIGYYVDMQLARWVLGEEEISDETFAAFAASLDEMGLSQFLTFWQDILDNL